MRLAGIIKQYSKNALPHEVRIVTHSARWVSRRWPYHAQVINTLDTTSRARGTAKLGMWGVLSRWGEALPLGFAEGAVADFDDFG